jgi:predicted Zn-dependent protease
VLAHEIGHVEHRHGTRMVIEQGVLSIGLGLALGDVSSLVSLGGTLLTGLAYKREHESEADCFALALMARAGVPSAPTGELLQALSAQAGGNAADLPSWLSSHPPTPERVRSWLQARRAPASPEPARTAILSRTRMLRSRPDSEPVPGATAGP